MAEKTEKKPSSIQRLFEFAGNCTSIWQLLRGYLRQSVHSSHLFHFTLYGD